MSDIRNAFGMQAGPAPQPAQQPAPAQPGPAAPGEGGGALNPATIEAFRNVLIELKKLPGMTDERLVAFLTEFTLSAGINLTQEQVAKIVAAVPGPEGQQGPPPGGAPPGGMMPPGGAPPTPVGR